MIGGEGTSPSTCQTGRVEAKSPIFVPVFARRQRLSRNI